VSLESFLAFWVNSFQPKLERILFYPPPLRPVLSSLPTPTASSERFALVDAVRGLALLGILWINFYNTAGFFISNVPAGLERNTVYLEQFLGYGKFISLFSLLFGIGFALQLERLKARLSAARATLIYSRRLLVLLVLGVLHYLLVWEGDVLHIYAAVGAALLLVSRGAKSPDYRPFLLLGAAIFIITSLSNINLEFPAEPERGSYFDFVAARGKTLFAFLGGNIALYLTWLLGVFLYGKHLVESGKLTRPLEHLIYWRKTLRWALPLGLGINALHVFLLTRGDYTGYDLHPVIGFPLALVYLCGMVFFYARGGRSRWLEAAGRMALSNYLAQSLCFTVLLYTYGFHLSRWFTPTRALLYIALFFALQCVLSRLWLSRFRMGPMEWLWRSLTYGKWQSFRLEPARVASEPEETPL